MEDVIVALLIGIISGLVSSLCYFLFMRAVKPKIVVAPSIVVKTTGEATNYSIKVVNKTKSDLIDIYYTFQIYSISPDGIVDTSYIEPTKPILRHIEKCSKSENDTYAIRLSFSDEMQRTLLGDSYLVFTIYATHAFSGGRIVLQTKYKETQLIENGTYETGKSVKILRSKSRDFQTTT